MSDTQASGADLARQALAQYKAASKTPPAKGRAGARKRRLQRGTGRDPQAFSDVLDQLAALYGWRQPSAGGQLIARWKRIAPEGLRALATPERYDAETGTLHLNAVSYAAATKLRVTTSRIAEVLNQAVGADTVKAVKILQPGTSRTAPRPEPVLAEPPPAAELGPIKEREAAPVGFQEAMAAVQEARASLERDPDQNLRDRYFADTRNTLRETAPEQPEGGATHAAEAADTYARALEVARAAKAGRAPAIPTAFQRTA